MASILERVKSVFAPQAVKARPGRIVFWPQWREGLPQWRMTDLSSYIEEGYDANAIIYSAIMFKVRAAYGAILRAYEGTRDEPVLLDYDHELSLLVDRPNHFQSFAELQAELITYFNLMGNAYVWFRREAGSEYPTAFYGLRPDWVHHIYQGQTVVGYVYAPAGVAIEDGARLLPEDTMHVRLPNPGDPHTGMGKGMSPISPLARSGDVDNAATAFLKRFFDDGAMPRGILSVDAPLTDQIVEEATERWMEAYGGNANWIKPLIMGHGASYDRIGSTFAELDMARIDARNESRIVMCFGVPLTLIEARPDLAQATYSNKQQDYKMFLETTLLPELDMFQQEWRYYLRSEDGRYFAQYDLERVPGYLDAAQRLDQIKEGWIAGAATRREYRQALGFSVSEADDVYQRPFNVVLVPADAMAHDPQSESGSESATEDEGAKALAPVAKGYLADEYKCLLWRAIDAKATSWEPQARRAVLEAFEADRREVLALVGEGQKAAYHERKTVAWSLLLVQVTDYLRMASKDTWRSTLAPVLAAVVVDQGEQLNALFGMRFDVRNLLAEDWFQSYRMIFADPISDTSNRALHELFERAMAEGWSVPQMQKATDLLFQQWMHGDVPAEDVAFAMERLPPHRTEMIARTETMRASNAGADALYHNWGVRQKEWISTLDGRQRPTHEEANGQVVGIDESFLVGGVEMRYPGDENAPLDLVVNCRCSVLPAGL